ncbi:GNAT family N-acetyltransferase [Paracoccus sp. (in: a-proteobacteria)]|uniref:GNAT family N-acetyltransferase n=1 Tax=Paracoccus sp. TaxID=267 RepID=UPI003A885403
MNMLVDPDCRGRGIAGQFLDSLLAISDRQDRPIWLQVLKGNQAAERLYASRHFFPAYDYGYYRPTGRT